MGFRTLAIESARAIWQLLSTVKAEFGKFAGVLERAHSRTRHRAEQPKRAGVRAHDRNNCAGSALPGSEAQGALSLDESAGTAARLNSSAPAGAGACCGGFAPDRVAADSSTEYGGGASSASLAVAVDLSNCGAAARASQVRR